MIKSGGNETPRRFSHALLPSLMRSAPFDRPSSSSSYCLSARSDRISRDQQQVCCITTAFPPPTMSSTLGKLMTREYYAGLLTKMHNYYHPMFRAGRSVVSVRLFCCWRLLRACVTRECVSRGNPVTSFGCLLQNKRLPLVFSPLKYFFLFSATPLWHCMIAVSAVMYTTSYMARDCTYRMNVLDCSPFISAVLCFSELTISPFLVTHRQANSTQART